MNRPEAPGAADLRLVGPALAAWAAAALALDAPAGRTAAGVAVGLAVAGLLMLAACRRPGRLWRAAPALAAALLCACAGAGVAGLQRAEARAGPVADLARDHARVLVELTVGSDPRVAGSGSGSGSGPPVVVLDALVTGVTGPDGARTRVETPVRVLAGHPGWARLQPSTRVSVVARLAPARGGERAVALLRPAADTPPGVTGGPDTAQRLAGRLRAGLREATGGLAPDARALLPGLVVGDTSRVPTDLQEAFRATDLLHLLAVSGSNLTVVLFLLIGPPARAQQAERRGLAPRIGLSLRATALCGAGLTLAFVVVCRPEPSVLRAAACGAVTLLAIATGRRRSLIPALGAAVLLLVLYDPWLARSYGFLLSVLATGALLTLAPRWSEALTRRGMRPRLAEALGAAAAAQAVCAPVVAVLAARVSLVAVPCNLLAELAAGPATVLGFAALAVAPLWMSAAKVLAWCAGVPAGWIAAVARAGAGLPGAELAWPGGLTGGLLLAAATLAVIVLGARVGRRRLVCSALAVLLLLAVLRPPQLTRTLSGWPPPDWSYVQCAVGQGDAAVLAVGPGEAVVVDAGPDPGPVDACLRSLGVIRVPMLLLTHFHSDHVAGLSGVLRGRSVGVIQTTALEEPPGQAQFVHRTAAGAGVPVVRAVAGERRRAGPLEWQVLWPPAAGAPPEGPNDASVALLVRGAGLTLLLLGDLEPAAQQGLLRDHPELGPVDVLKVAHHGSAHQDPVLYAQVRPRIALVPVGAGNRYGHPAPGTLAQLRAMGATVLRTDTDGSIAVTGSGPRMRAFPAGRRRSRHAHTGQGRSVCPQPDSMIECVFARAVQIHTARGCISHVRSPTGDGDGRKFQPTHIRDTDTAADGAAAQLPGSRHGPPAGPAGRVRGDRPDRPTDRQRRDGPVRRVHGGRTRGRVPALRHRRGVRAVPRGDARGGPGTTRYRGDHPRRRGAAAAAAARPLGARPDALVHRLHGPAHRLRPDRRTVQHVRRRGTDS
ncbi:ComEC/Rec2 family competence protein [Streptomyces sp. NBC_00190]